MPSKHCKKFHNTKNNIILKNAKKSYILNRKSTRHRIKFYFMISNISE